MKINTFRQIIIVTIFIIIITVFISLLVRPQQQITRLPPILAINLPERKDRREKLLTEFQSWPQQPEVIEAVRRKPGWKGCTLSHLKCIEIAKKRKYPWVLCIEDDCQLTPNSLKYFNSILPYLWTTRDKWDIYSGGISSIKRIGKTISKEHNISEANGYAAHFILIHEGTYDKVLNDISKEDDRLQKIDVYYNDHLRIWTSVPFLAVQRSDVSDIEGRETNYIKLFKQAENTLMNILQLSSTN